MAEYSFRAGDVVKHRPSGEQWRLAAVTQTGRVLPCGYPETIAEASDCELIEAASDDRHIEMVKELLKPADGATTGDVRFDYRRILARERALELGLAEMVQVECGHCKGTGKVLRWQRKPEPVAGQIEFILTDETA